MAAARNASTSTTNKNGRGVSRLSFAKISDTLTVPDLLALQTESFDWLVGNEAWKARVADAKAAFEKMSGRVFKRILIVGGGSKNRLLCQATADAAGIPVISFALEGTAVGNMARQLIALGAVKNLATFRALLGKGLKQTVYAPRR